MENINLDVDAVLKTIVGQRATNPQAQVVINEFLRLVLNRQTFTSSDLQTALAAQLQPINDQLGALMATVDQVKAQSQANAAQLQKVVAEVSEMASKLKDLQDAGSAAIAEAVAAARAQDQATLEAKLEEVASIQSEENALIGQLDAFNADVAPEPPPPPPV